MKLMEHQIKIVNRAIEIIDSNKKVGLNVVTKGGKSYIAGYLVEHYKKLNKCRKIVWLAPKAANNNVVNGVFKNLQYTNDITFINKEMLSRGFSIRDILAYNQVNYKSVDMIIIDEAHTMFGDNIKEQLSKDLKDFEDAMLIAMTASAYSNMKNINTLEKLVGSENIVSFQFSDAVSCNVIRKLDYYPSVLTYSKKSLNMIERLSELPIKSIYVQGLIERLNKVVEMTNDNVVNKMYNVMNKPETELLYDASEGVRIFVFFSRDVEVVNGKNIIEELLLKLYHKDVEEHGIKINYLKYTSTNTKEEDKVVLNTVNNESKPYVIDVIATVDKGGFSIHPKNVHYGIVLRGTQSITKYIQILGRMTSLTGVDKFNTTVFDFKDNMSLLGEFTYGIGSRCMESRVRSRNSSDVVKNSEEEALKSTPTLKLHKDENMTEVEDLYSRIETLINIETNMEKIGDIIDKNLSYIDFEYGGNIAKFFNTEKSEEYSYYKAIQSHIISNNLNAEDLKDLSKRINKYGHRLYIGLGFTEEDIELTKELYRDIKRFKTTGVMSTYCKNKYCLKYVCNTYNSNINSLIKMNYDFAEELIKHIKNLKSTDFNCSRSELKMGLTFIDKVDNIDFSLLTEEEKDELSCEAVAMVRYLVDIRQIDFGKAVYMYMATLYNNILQFHRVTELENRSLNCAVKIVKASEIGDFTILSVLENKYIGKIANDFEHTNTLVKQLFKIANINDANKLNNSIVRKSYMWQLLEQAISNKDKEKLQELRKYLHESELPSIIANKLNSKEVRSIERSNIEDKEVKIFVQGLVSDNKAKKTRLIRQAIKEQVVTQKDIIAYCFPNMAMPLVEDIIDSLSNGDEADVESVKKYFNKPYCTPIILDTVKTSNILDKKHEKIVENILNSCK